MKTYCKTVDITDRKLIQKAVYKCLKKKYKRRDSLTMFSEYTGLPTDTIKGMFNEFGLNGMKPMFETVVDGVREEIIQGNIHFQPIWYREKIDASSQKVRRIGIQNIKQQIYDYIAVEAMKDGEVILLENTRFRPEETKNGEAFSKDLASICDVFVNDAFGTAHRAHCSNVGVAQLVDTAVVGYLMQKEIDFLGNAVENPVRPFVAILGGAKVADKLNVISNLLEKCDTLIIGGGMAYTFLKAQGYEIGLSLVDDSKLDYCKEMMEKAEKLGKKLLLPVDAVTIKDFPNPIDAPVEVEVYDSDKMPADREGCDIGPKTQALFADAVKTAKTVVWNGPMGVFENPTLAAGTIAVAKALADTDATTIIGGGDSAAAVNQLGFGDKMTHISTGGGASLEFLEGKELPGVAAANDK